MRAFLLRKQKVERTMKTRLAEAKARLAKVGKRLAKLPSGGRKWWRELVEKCKKWFKGK